MTATTISLEIVSKLEQLRSRCPQFRLGQMLSAIDSVGEAMSGRSLYHIEDSDFIAAVDKFVSDASQIPQESPASAE